MKVAITGKGGTGKTTLSGILAHLFMEQGKTVLAVDADPDANLASALGIPQELLATIRPLSAQRDLIKERTGAEPGQFGQFFKLNPTVKDIPDDFCLTYRNIRLLVMGAVRMGGDGCACPEHVLLKSLLEEIILHRDDVVIVDMEAGIEHLGRATAAAVDKMLIVVEPGSRSLATAETILQMGRDIGLSNFGIVANKIRSVEQKNTLLERIDPALLFGTIPFSEAIQEADLAGRSPMDTLSPALRESYIRIFQKLKQEPEDSPKD